MFGSFERGLDKMKNMLTPGKKGSNGSAPRKVKTVKSRFIFCTRFICRNVKRVGDANHRVVSSGVTQLQPKGVAAVSIRC